MIAVDWGTTNLRAFRLGADGTVRDRLARPTGILQVLAGEFAAALRAAIGPWLADGETRILLSGMVGSRQGWVQAPYLPCPAGVAELATALVAVPFDDAETWLVPGLSARDEAGMPEVMRGEETQIAGVIDRVPPRGCLCLPGSHAKWVRLDDGRIAGFTTYFTGEAFAALRDATILGRMMDRDGPIDPEGFARGLGHAAAPGHLLHHLFGVRSLALFDELSEAEAAGYLSGLLIGHEVRAALAPGATVFLVGAAPLCALYGQAIAAAGGRAVVLDEDAAAAGLARIAREAGWH